MKLYIGQREGGGPVGFAVVPEVSHEIRHGGGAEEFGGAEGEAAANRAKFGQPVRERKAREAEAERAARLLDGMKREPD